MNHFAEILTLKLTYLIMQQRQTSKIFQTDTSSFALKSNLAGLKAEVDKLDIDNLVPVSADLSKLIDVVKSDVIKKSVYNRFAAKVNNTGTGASVLKARYDTDQSEIENKILDTSGLVKKTDYNTKIIEIEGKIPGISGLTTNAALTTVENEIPNVGSLKKTDYDTNITEIEKKLTGHNHDQYITTPEFNARLAQENLIPKKDLDAFISKARYDTVKPEIENKIPDTSGLVKK